MLNYAVRSMGNILPSPEELQDEEFHTFLSFYNCLVPIIALLIVGINSCVTISSGLLIKKRVEPRFTYLFLGNVAITDTIIGLSILFGHYFPRSRRNHWICSIQIGLIVTSALSSIYSVGLLAIDRFLYIVYGIKYCKWISSHRVRLVIALTWLLALILGFLPLMGWSGDTKNGKICWFIVAAPDALIILIVSTGIIPILLVVVLYSIILYHALANIKQIQSSSVFTISHNYTVSSQVVEEQPERLRMFRGGIEMIMKMKLEKPPKKQHTGPSKWKAIKIVLFTTGSFLITWAPYFCASVLYVVENCKHLNDSDYCKTLKLAIASPLTMLGFCNSLVNPLIYAWWHNGFRNFIKKRIKRIFK